MVFFKNFLLNLVILMIIGIALYFIFPAIMSSIFQLYGVLLVPLAIIIAIMISLPGK